MCSSSRLAPNGSSFGCRYVGRFCLLLVFSRCRKIRLEAFSLDGGISIPKAAAADMHAHQGTWELSAWPGAGGGRGRGASPDSQHLWLGCKCPIKAWGSLADQQE